MQDMRGQHFVASDTFSLFHSHTHTHTHTHTKIVEALYQGRFLHFRTVILGSALNLGFKPMGEGTLGLGFLYPRVQHA